MGKQAQTIELSTDLGINYIPCCSIVLMCYNGLYKRLYLYGVLYGVIPRLQIILHFFVFLFCLYYIIL